MLPSGKDRMIVTSPRLALPSSETNDNEKSASDDGRGVKNVKLNNDSNDDVLALGCDLNELSLKRAKYGTNCCDVNNSSGDVYLQSQDVIANNGVLLHSPTVKVTCSEKDNVTCGSTTVELRSDRSRSRSRGNSAKRLSNVSADLLNTPSNRNSDSELERFFNDMGLDLDQSAAGATAATLLGPNHGYSTVSLNSIGGASSLDSTARARSLSSHDSLTENVTGQPSAALKQRSVDGLDAAAACGIAPSSSCGSVVERNARIIKWLCSVKRASSKDEIA